MSYSKKRTIARVILGRVDKAAVRPPLMNLPQVEIDRLRLALDDAGVTGDGALLHAA